MLNSTSPNSFAHLGGVSTRRTFLNSARNGLGLIALSQLFGSDILLAERSGNRVALPQWDGVVSPLHHRPRIKRIIHLYMAGGPTHLETLDYKPKLGELHGKEMPKSVTEGQPIAQLQGQKLKCFGPQHDFRRFGRSGQLICEAFPKIGSMADDICVIRSMRSIAINHDPAHTFFNTGTTVSGRPSIGAWLLYGLGSETNELPGFVVMSSIGKGGQSQPIAARQWHSGFLPSRFQGVEFRSKGDPVLYVSSPQGVNLRRQRDVVNAVQSINQLHLEAEQDPEVATRIAQYEMAFRMQTSVPGLIDLSGESQKTLDLYGTKGADGSFAANCLLARRLIERGVRFVQCYHRGWDHHGNLKNSVKITAGEVDRASAALLEDLKERGLLEDTLVIWGGEFGRTPMAQGSGRDHHIKGYSMWLAGGGVRGGLSYGSTDELGYNAVENVVEVHDVHATLLHLLGIDHERLSVKFQGRDLRLTDVHGKVLHSILT